MGFSVSRPDFLVREITNSEITDQKSCSKLTQQVNDLTRTILSSLGQNLPANLEICDTLKESVEAFQQQVNEVEQTDHTKALNTACTKLLESINGKIEQDRKQVAKDLPRMITQIYEKTDLESSLGQFFGSFSSENRELRRIAQADYEKLSTREIVQFSRRAAELVQKGKQQIDVEKATNEMVDLMRKVIRKAYKFEGFTRSLGKFYGERSRENKQLKEFLNRNYKPASREVAVDDIDQALKLIEKGFQQLKKPYPEDLAHAIEKLKEKRKAL